jgi:threonine/homoserine/homoserine lactone efflux protein
VSNPVTAAYFLAQFVGPLAEAGAGSAAVLLVLLQALAWTALVGIIFAQPAARRLALAHHRLVCTASGLALAVLAFAMLRPLLPLP